MIKAIHRIFIVVVLLLFCSKAEAQSARVNAVLDSSKIRIGEQVKLDIYLNYEGSQNVSIEWPRIGDTLTEKVEVISVTPIDTTIPDKSRPTNFLQHQQIIVSAYDSGFFSIPGFRFVFNNDTAHPMYTQPLFLEVHTVPTDSSDKKIKDIKPPFDEPFNWKWYTSYIYLGIGALFLIAIIVIVTVYLTKRRQQAMPEPEKPKVPAHITALAALEKVKAQAIWKEGQIKEYYSSISDAVRLYIEERFQVHALESTTDEIMTAFRSQVVDKESKDKLQQLLMLSDLVKFAKQAPIESEHAFTLQNAFDFVNGTKRADEAYVADETAIAQQTEGSPSEKQPLFTTPASNNTGFDSAYMPGSTTGSFSSKPLKKSPEFVPYTVEPENKKKVMTRRIALGAAALVTVLLIGLLVRSIVLSGNTSNKELLQALNQINGSCPVMVDSQTRLDGAMLRSAEVVEFNYTFIRITGGQIDTDAIKAQMQPAVIEQVKNNPQLEMFRSHNLTIQFTFHDMDGETLFSIKVEPQDYSTNI